MNKDQAPVWIGSTVTVKPSENVKAEADIKKDITEEEAAKIIAEKFNAD